MTDATRQPGQPGGMNLDAVRTAWGALGKALGLGTSSGGGKPNAPAIEASDDGTEVRMTAKVLKVDTAKRLVWGWASVIEEGGKAVVDKQGDVIGEDELLAAVHDFHKSARAARVMHDGVDMGEVVEGLVFTRSLQKALGVDLGRVGYLLGMEMPADVVARVASGDLTMFSIGGTAVREELADG